MYPPSTLPNPLEIVLGTLCSNEMASSDPRVFSDEDDLDKRTTEICEVLMLSTSKLLVHNHVTSAIIRCVGSTDVDGFVYGGPSQLGVDVMVEGRLLHYCNRVNTVSNCSSLQGRSWCGRPDKKLLDTRIEPTYIFMTFTLAMPTLTIQAAEKLTVANLRGTSRSWYGCGRSHAALNSNVSKSNKPTLNQHVTCSYFETGNFSSLCFLSFHPHKHTNVATTTHNLSYLP
ncbi:uncharacterized protein LACBIDRAFT_321717 [Laccaria bicolor S238N-H82]|uniref:Predicted protein n=1 Tax=Laccaria bicolor (strain S238N-H82 / ATCC MYA-4686) TaxID=486041 RepID=B0CTW9_LACBS|nr:uncharacterized protein LACBIDRAFT_321717 [Laccaria bicolor S238N-H82]EDR14572.1 predicted protein [Laccaria bicolor S238N-H82]|eukprot:XP_001875131.1 predicted protein [Laccaria bicolor S238N-H82]